MLLEILIKGGLTKPYMLLGFVRNRLCVLRQAYPVGRRPTFVRDPRELVRTAELLGLHPVAHQQYRHQLRQNLHRILLEEICTGQKNKMVP